MRFFVQDEESQLKTVCCKVRLEQKMNFPQNSFGLGLSILDAPRAPSVAVQRHHSFIEHLEIIASLVFTTRADSRQSRTSGCMFVLRRELTESIRERQDEQRRVFIVCGR